LAAGTIINDDSADNLDVSSGGENNDVAKNAEENNDVELSSALCFTCSSIYALKCISSTTFIRIPLLS
jgi:hypothetical protein